MRACISAGQGRGHAARAPDPGLEHLAEMLRAFSRRLPVLILLEDLHWADDSSIDALTKILPSLRSDRVTVVGAGRPDFLERFPQWGKGGHPHDTIRLVSLSDESCRLLVDEILRKIESIPETLREMVVKQADGNPFYVEELIKMFMEDGIITEPRDIDIAVIFGFGFPPFRGGVLHAADTAGIGHVVKRMGEFQKKYGERFTPAKMLVDMERSGKKFFPKG